MKQLSPERVGAGRVLIVDDQPEVAEGIKQLLEYEGMVVNVQTSLITLPLMIRQFDPDVVLLDLSMPGLGGTAYFASGARKFIQAGTLIILFSGRSSQELSRLSEELGADGFISKEQDAWDVVVRVKSWIKHRHAVAFAAGRNVNHADTRTSSASSN